MSILVCADCGKAFADLAAMRAHRMRTRAGSRRCLFVDELEMDAGWVWPRWKRSGDVWRLAGPWPAPYPRPKAAPRERRRAA